MLLFVSGNGFSLTGMKESIHHKFIYNFTMYIIFIICVIFITVNFHFVILFSFAFVCLILLLREISSAHRYLRRLSNNFHQPNIRQIIPDFCWGFVTSLVMWHRSLQQELLLSYLWLIMDSSQGVPIFVHHI